MSIENSNKKLRNDLIGVAGVHLKKCLKGPRSFYLFLRYLQEKRFETFLEAGDNVTKQVLMN